MSPEAFRSRMQVQRQSKPGARLLLDRVRSVRRRPRVGGRRRAVARVGRRGAVGRAGRVGRPVRGGVGRAVGRAVGGAEGGGAVGRAGDARDAAEGAGVRRSTPSAPRAACR